MHLNCTYDKNATGLFVWAKLPAHFKSEEFIDLVLKEHSFLLHQEPFLEAMAKVIYGFHYVQSEG